MKKTLLTALLALALSAAAHAQSATTATAVVTAPGAQPMAMPLNIYVLPYGTIKITEGSYYIANYEGTGISIYIQSPTPLRIATLEEMVRYQAEWARLTTTASAPTPVSTPKAAAVTAPTAQPVAAVAPAAAQSLPMLTMPSGQPLTAATVTQSATPMSTMAAGTAPASMTMPVAQTTMPVQSAQPVQQQMAWTQPAPMAAAPTSAPQTTPAPTWTQVQAAPAVNTMAFPQAAQAFPTAQTYAAPQASPNAQTGMMPAVAATMAPTPIPAPQAPSATAVNTYSPATTLVPNYLRLSFRGRGNTLTYSIGNNSSDATVRLDPQSVRIYQDGQIVPANLSVRDSTGDTTSGALSPRAMLVGTVNVVTRSTSPITLMWQATDAQGRTYPISYAWLPQ